MNLAAALRESELDLVAEACDRLGLGPDDADGVIAITRAADDGLWSEVHASGGCIEVLVGIRQAIHRHQSRRPGDLDKPNSSRVILSVPRRDPHVDGAIRHCILHSSRRLS